MNNLSAQCFILNFDWFFVDQHWNSSKKWVTFSILFNSTAIKVVHHIRWQFVEISLYKYYKTILCFSFCISVRSAELIVVYCTLNIKLCHWDGNSRICYEFAIIKFISGLATSWEDTYFSTSSIFHNCISFRNVSDNSAIYILPCFKFFPLYHHNTVY